MFGDGVLHADDIIGNAFSDALSIALSYASIDAPVLDSRLYKGSIHALNNLSTALRKYGNGDHTDAPRASRVARSAGICLAATTSGAGCVSNVDDTEQGLGSTRLQCAEALFNLLGSTSFRKDEEVALVAGESLGQYADAYSPKGVVWSSESKEWPKEMDDEFAQGLPPHQQVRPSRAW